MGYSVHACTWLAQIGAEARQLTRKSRSWSAAMSLLNPLCRHKSYVSTRNYSNDASGVTRDLRLISDTAPPWTTRLLRGEFEHAPRCTQLTHVRTRKEVTPEVECCDSRFDKNLTSSRLAESPPPKDNSAGRRHKQYPRPY